MGTQTYLLVPSQHLASFTIPPEERYVGQHICATGLVQADKDRIAHVVVVSPAQIEIVDERPTPPFGRRAYRACERGVSEPKLRKEVRPSYPSGNLVARKIEDVLLLEAVVGIDGSVTESRTVYGKYPEFHEEAHRAVRQWRFEAGKRDGVRVPVIVQIEMQFVLR